MSKDLCPCCGACELFGSEKLCWDCRDALIRCYASFVTNTPKEQA